MRSGYVTEHDWYGKAAVIARRIKSRTSGQRCSPIVVVKALDPRRIPVSAALEILREAGFVKVVWRPFFVPEEKKLPLVILRTLVACESIPCLRSLPLRWKFLALVKGEIG